MTDASEMDLGWESLKGFSGKLVQAALGFVGTVVFARELGPVSFGGFYFLLAILFIVDRPIRGIGQAVRKRFSESDAPREEIVGTVLLFNMALFVVVAVGAFLLGDQLKATTNVNDAGLVFVLLFVAIGLFFPFQQMLAAEGRVGKQTWNDTLRSVFTLPLQLTFVFAGFGAAGMGYGLAAATLLVIPVAVYFIRVPPAVPSRESVRAMWDYVKYSMPTSLVGETFTRFDVLLLGAVLTTATVANYETAYKLVLPASFLYTVVSSGLMPKISALDSRGDPVAAEVTNAVSFVSSLSVPIFFGALAIPRGLVVTAYGGEYAGATVLLVGLALHQVVRSQSIIFRQVIDGLDRPDVGLKVDATTLGVNVVLGVALVFPFGPVGVVAATVLAEGVRYGLAAAIVARWTDGVTFLPRTLGEQALAGLVMFGAVELVHGYVPIRSWLTLLFIVGTGAAVYSLVLVAVSEKLRLTIRAVYRDATA